jgi:ribosome-associated translation inhibitor RaiA
LTPAEQISTQKHKNYEKAIQHDTSRSQQSYTKYLNDSEVDEISNIKLKRMMVIMINEMNEDVYKHLNKIKENMSKHLNKFKENINKTANEFKDNTNKQLNELKEDANKELNEVNKSM